MPKPKDTEIPRVVAFSDDGLVRLTCLARVQDDDPNAGLFAIGYALMRLVQVVEGVRDEVKAEIAAERAAEGK